MFPSLSSQSLEFALKSLEIYVYILFFTVHFFGMNSSMWSKEIHQIRSMLDLSAVPQR